MPRSAPKALSVPSSLAAEIEKGMTLQALFSALRKGADPNAADENGSTPMHAAIERNWWKGADMLLSFGAAPPPYDGDPNGKPLLNFETDSSQRETALTYILGSRLI
jgi:ankyrin repeat protein